MERDILVEVNHPFIVKLHYGKRHYNICHLTEYFTGIGDVYKMKKKDFQRPALMKMVFFDIFNVFWRHFSDKGHIKKIKPKAASLNYSLFKSL